MHTGWAKPSSDRAIDFISVWTPTLGEETRQMATFQLTTAGDTYDFDLTGVGTVRKNATDFGAWGTNRSNQIVVTPKVGAAPAPFPVKWQFNGKNELCLFDGAKQLCNLHDA